MKKKKIEKLTLNRETLHPLTKLEQEKLREVAGGVESWDMWTCTCHY